MAKKFTKLNIGDSVASSGGRVWKKLSSMLRLSAPTLSLDGDMLTITDNSQLATSFDILVDGEVKGTATGATFDLSTLDFEVGSYSISVIARADGYIDSAESEAVSYEATDSIVGTWIWNNDIYEPNSTSQDITWKGDVNLNFSSGNYSNLTGIQIGNGGMSYRTGSSFVLNGAYVWGIYDKWVKNPQYRTITIFDDVVSVDTTEWTVQEFKTWLKANAAKQ